MAGVGDQHLAIWLSAATASANFLFTIVGIWLVERIGRKKLLLSSLMGVSLSLVLLAISFQLAAYTSPQSSNWMQDNSSCSSYRSCSPCIHDTDCGFCFFTDNGSVNGSCLAVDPDDEEWSRYKACDKYHLSLDTKWAYGYCPTSYSWMAIFGLVLYLAFFAPGMGPMPWTINSELYPLWARSCGTSLSTATNWISNLIVSMTFLTLTEQLTEYGTYWLFVGLSVIAFIFFVTLVPETKGRKLEEVDMLFAEPWCRCGSDSRSKQYTSLGNEGR